MRKKNKFRLRILTKVSGLTMGKPRGPLYFLASNPFHHARFLFSWQGGSWYAVAAAILYGAIGSLPNSRRTALAKAGRIRLSKRQPHCRS